MNNKFLKMSFAEAFKLSLKQSINIMKRRKGDFKTMNKQEIISAIALNAELTKKDSGIFLNAFLDVVGAALAQGEEVKIMGLGTFKTIECKERNGVNPQTGEIIKIAARKKVHVKMSKALKVAVNQ